MLNKFYFSILFGLAITLTACGDDDSSGVSGSFPDGGDPKFYCEVTDGTDSDGTIWVQFKLNVPNRFGQFQKRSLKKDGTELSYWERTYYNLNSKMEKMMCEEFEEDIKQDLQREDNGIEDYACGNGVEYVHYKEQTSKKNLDSVKKSFEEECEDFQRKRDEGDLD